MVNIWSCPQNIKRLTRARSNKLVWSICDIKFQSIMLVFQVKLFATLARGNAASFYVNQEQVCLNTIYAS